MLKELIKIQILVALIFVMNAIATQNLKFIGNENIPTNKIETSKRVDKDVQKDITHSTFITSHNPRKILLDALKKSLN
ncbi:hypothetical protein [Halobacteriovorax sp.]|uniref:hypothetical protein n=1 Tax=Halobacteriovorax sp. TaxID=2020862 RepID=UPI003562F1EA